MYKILISLTLLLAFISGCSDKPKQPTSRYESTDANFIHDVNVFEPVVRDANWEQKQQQLSEAIGMSFKDLCSWAIERQVIESSPSYIVDMEGIRYPQNLQKPFYPYPVVDGNSLGYCDPAIQFSWVIFLPNDLIMPPKMLDLQNKLKIWYFSEGIDKEPVNSEKRNLNNIFNFTACQIPICVWKKDKSVDVKVNFSPFIKGQPNPMPGWKLQDYYFADVFITILSKNGKILELSTRPCLISTIIDSNNLSLKKVRIDNNRCVVYIN